jgi:hypothetical protein
MVLKGKTHNMRKRIHMRKTRKMRGGLGSYRNLFKPTVTPYILGTANKKEPSKWENEHILNHPNIRNLEYCLYNLNDKCIDAMAEMILTALDSKYVNNKVTYNTFFGPYTYGGFAGIRTQRNMITRHFSNDHLHYPIVQMDDSLKDTIKMVIKSFRYTKSIDYFKLTADVKRTTEMYSSGNSQAIRKIKMKMTEIRNLIMQQLLNCDKCESGIFKSTYVGTTEHNVLFDTSCDPYQQSTPYTYNPRPTARSRNVTIRAPTLVRPPTNSARRRNVTIRAPSAGVHGYIGLQGPESVSYGRPGTGITNKNTRVAITTVPGAPTRRPAISYKPY